MKILTVSIIGVGARGGETYGRYMQQCSDKYKIVSLCDTSKERLDKWSKIFGIENESCFLSEDEFFSKKRSDLLVLSTMDNDHVRMAEKALDLGYDILLEKPITKQKEELTTLSKKVKESGRTVMVCHVLRYTATMKKLKELLDNGEIGSLISVDQIENVGFAHATHSFVRGNWRNSEETSPMILQKCCHDMDLLQYFVGAKCKSVSSMGSLAFFKQENAPADCAKRCLDCKYVNDCFYSAKRVYIDKWKRDGQPENAWPMNSITNVLPLTEKVLYDALKEGPFGRCVFYCDNNVVDNQVVCMQFENGVTATLKMQAFTKYGGRDITFFGSKGQLVLSEAEGTITLKKYWTEDKTWRLNELTDDLAGHGGGDHRMMDRLYDAITCSDSNIDTDIDNSVESHYMSLAAEQSRMEGGKLIQLKDYR